MPVNYFTHYDDKYLKKWPKEEGVALACSLRVTWFVRGDRNTRQLVKMPPQSEHRKKWLLVLSWFPPHPIPPLFSPFLFLQSRTQMVLTTVIMGLPSSGKLLGKPHRHAQQCVTWWFQIPGGSQWRLITGLCDSLRPCPRVTACTVRGSVCKACICLTCCSGTSVLHAPASLSCILASF